jgi:PKD repeat protein
MTSSDGITWTDRLVPTVATWNSVTFGNGLFVAVGNTAGASGKMTSPDGINWTTIVDPIGENTANTDVRFVNNIFIMTSQQTARAIQTSPDGTTWTVRHSYANSGMQGIAYGNGAYVVMDGAGYALRSTDSITWNQIAMPNSGWLDVVYAAGLFVALDQSRVAGIATSPDGITWTVRTCPLNFWNALAYGGSYFVAVAGDGVIMTSSDGITWALEDGLDAGIATSILVDIIYGTDKFVSVSNSGTYPVISGKENFTVDFSATPRSGVYPLNVQFTDESTGTPTTWSWDFGDTETSNEQNPSHTYTAPGVYTVALTSGDGVDSDTETKTGYIIVDGTGGLTQMDLTINGTPNPAPAPVEVAFTPSFVFPDRIIEDSSITYDRIVETTGGDVRITEVTIE